MYKNDLQKNIDVIEKMILYCKYSNDTVKRNQKEIYSKLDIKGTDISDLKLYKTKLWQLILDLITSFQKKDILFLAQFFREQYCFNIHPSKYADFMVEINEIGIIIQIAVFEVKKPFNSKGYFNINRLSTMFEAIQMYNIVNMKIEFSINNKLNIDTTNLFEPIESEIVDNYFRGYDLYFRTIKVEDIEIMNKDLRNWLERKKLTPSRIYEKTNDNLKEIFGFTYTDIDNLLFNLYKLNNKSFQYIKHHIEINKDQMCSIFSDIENIECILRYLSINHCFELYQKPTNRMIELRCITEDDNILNFAICNLKECLDIFRKVSITGQYFEEIGINEKYKPYFVDAQKDFSTFFCYVVADLFEQFNYKVPKKESGLIWAEIKTISLTTKKLHFKDIDVLVLDEKRKILYNCELKYFKVKMYYKNLNTDALDTRGYENIKKREKVLIENKSEILLSLFNVKDGNEYSVKSILITSRQNSNSKPIASYNFEEFKKLLLNKKEL